MVCVGIVCPKCGDFLTTPYPHPHDLPCFDCKKCNVIVEPTSFGSKWSPSPVVTTEKPPSAGQLHIYNHYPG